MFSVAPSMTAKSWESQLNKTRAFLLSILLYSMIFKRESAFSFFMKRLLMPFDSRHLNDHRDKSNRPITKISDKKACIMCAQSISNPFPLVQIIGKCA